MTTGAWIMLVLSAIITAGGFAVCVYIAARKQSANRK